ncbi:N-acetylglucosamine/diacetylchitobiose ABC transporter substrate-binding protein [Clostridium sp. CTA-7]
MKKRTLALLLSSLMVVSTLTGCGGKTTSQGSSDEKAKTLKIAAFEGGYGKVYWEKLKENFEKAHEGVTVELTVASNIEEVIRPQIQSGNIPDFIYLATGRKDALTETFIKEENLHELTNVLNMKVPGENVTVKDKLLPGFVDSYATNPYGDGKTYLAPLFYSPTGLFYNKALFKQKGYELPKTWDQMFALGDKAKADGISLWSYPTAGYLDCMIPPILAASGGVDSFKDAMNYKEGFWTSESATKALETIGKLKNYLDPTVVANANNQGFKNNQQLILDNKALFIPNGTWLPDEMKDAPRAEGFEWGFMPYPAFKDGGDQYSVSFIEQMYIPKDAKNKELAEEFMAYMYSDEAVEIVAENAKAVVPVKGSMEIASKHLDPLQVELLKMYDNGAKALMGVFAATKPVEGLTYSDVYVGTVDSVMTGDKTVADWQKSLQEATDKMRANIIK